MKIEEQYNKKIIAKTKKLEALKENEAAKILLEISSHEVFSFKILLILYRGGVISAKDVFLKNNILLYDELILVEGKDIKISSLIQDSIHKFTMFKEAMKQNEFAGVLLTFDDDLATAFLDKKLTEEDKQEKLASSASSFMSFVFGSYMNSIIENDATLTTVARNLHQQHEK